MFFCLSANPAIDKRLLVSEFLRGKVNRATNVRPAPGGKAAHVAMALKALGADPVWLGIEGGASGKELVDGLHEQGIKVQSIAVHAPTRVNLEIIEESGRVTEVLEPGGVLSESEVIAFQSACEGSFCSHPGSTVILSGSLPPDAPSDLYARIIRSAKLYKCNTFLDTSGTALKSGLLGRPDFVKPNREEAEQVTGITISDHRSRARALKSLLSLGARSAAISQGENGLIWCSAEDGTIHLAVPPRMRARSTVGCGDVTLAAFAFAGRQGLNPEETLRLAAACGAANCIAEMPGRILESNVRRLERDIRIEKLFE